ncbi:tetratricopeptide repeat protein, partial [Streptomyces alboniger]
ETLPRPESLAVADLLTRIGEEIEARAGSATRAFRAVVRVAQGAGSQGLASAGQPFALVSEEALGLLRGRAIRVVERAAPDELPGLDPPASVPSPPGLTNIPARPQPYFVGRHKELAILDDGLLPWSDTYGQQPRAMVVHGPEGVGKSALVAEWASVMATNNLMGPAWWVKANSAESINSGLAGLTRALQPSVASSFAEEEQVAWALRWFGAHENWILVLDDVYSADRMGPLLSSLGSHGFVLMTSRTPAGWSGTATSLALGVCELPDAVKMLNRRAGREVEGAGALCEELGRLPLAVTRAGAFLAGTDMTVDHYRSRLALQEVQVHPDEMAAQGVIKTRLLAAVDPLARQLLLVLAWYGPQPVPRDVLGPESATSDVSLALHFLASCSMIGLTADAVTLQPVLAKAAREPDDDHRLSGSREIDDARLTAALWLRNALPRKTDDPADWPRWRQLLPHIDALLEHGRPVADDRHFVELLARTAPFLLTQGATGKAVAYLERVLRDSQRLYGPEVEQTLTLAAELADAYVANGEAGEAINLYAYMLDAMSGAGRGEDDPDVLWLRAKRASARQDSGDPEGAVRELDEVCHRAASSLGEEHSHTLLMRVSLAGAYRAAGEPVRAVVVLEQTLAVCRRVWGDASADTLAVQMELASVCEAVGDMPRAAEVLEEAVRGLRTVFGYPHPRTFRAMADLAALYAAGGMAGRAVELLEEALAGAATVLGERHPAVLAVRQTLAETWLHDGAPEQAVPVLEEVLSDRGAVLGEDHRDTLRSADSLAAAYGAAGMRGRQRTLYKRTLNARLRMLEANDPETLMSYDRLADAMDGAGPAVVLRVRAHQGRVRTLGEDHPETLAALERLAHALRAAGNTSQALTFFQQSLELRRHTQGPAETDTLRVLGTLARIHLSEGDTAAAITAYKDAVAQAPARREAAVVLERAVAHLTSVLGAGHPEVRDLTKRLARLR